MLVSKSVTMESTEIEAYIAGGKTVCKLSKRSTTLYVCVMFCNSIGTSDICGIGSAYRPIAEGYPNLVAVHTR